MDGGVRGGICGGGGRGGPAVAAGEGNGDKCTSERKQKEKKIELTVAEVD